MESLEQFCAPSPPLPILNWVEDNTFAESIAYKAFKSYEYSGEMPRNLHARGKIYSIDTVHEVKGRLILCENGFHYCASPVGCYVFYDYDDVMCEIKVLGHSIRDKEGTKYCTNKYTIVKVMHGTYTIDAVKYTYHNGRLHSTVVPALEYENGKKSWFYHGISHRADGPAYEVPGLKEWICSGKYNRVDGPALINSNGNRLWYIHGVLHRKDGPAAILQDGSQIWFKHGKLHREDGPALTVNYIVLDFLVVFNHADNNKTSPTDITEVIAQLRSFSCGTDVWFHNGQIHRDNDEPAVQNITSVSTYRFWYQHGLLHRDCAPAKELGLIREWYQHGKPHRICGAAYSDIVNEKFEYYIDGELICGNFPLCNVIAEYNECTIL